MSEADRTPADNDSELRLAFFRKLQAVTTKIHATSNLDEIMLDLGMEFCDLFECDRFTLYAMDHEKNYIVSKVKTGLTSFRDLKLAINPSSIAGYVALTRQTLNIRDVYDSEELRRISPELHFQQGVDQRTGYRTRQMLVAPLEAVAHDSLLGVVQFINTRNGQPFSSIALEGVRQLCDTLAVAFSQRAAGAAAAHPLRCPGGRQRAVGAGPGASPAHRARKGNRRGNRAGAGVPGQAGRAGRGAGPVLHHPLRTGAAGPRAPGRPAEKAAAAIP
jgi:hypothetical protein